MKKIMFDDNFDLTELTLKGVKTRTSRIVRRLPDSFIRPIGLVRYGQHKGWFEYLYGAGAHGMFKPPYQIGEKIAVAQSYRTLLESEYLPTKIENQVITMVEQDHKGVGNKMYVRADLMAHYIEVIDLRMERLQDISDEDCLREGIVEYYPYIDRNPNDRLKTYRFRDKRSEYGYYNLSPVRDCFAVLIDRISGKGTWDSNPWIWAIDYKIVKE